MTLDQWLKQSRQQAKLGLDEVCHRTKIQARYVNALEQGDYGALPSNTHLRAFSLALARACGADESRTAELVRQTLEAVAPPPAKPALFNAEPPRPASPAPASAPAAPSAPALLSPVMEAMEAAVAPPPPPAFARAASAAAPATALERLRSIPWPTLSGLALGAGALMLALFWLASTLSQAPGSPAPSAAPTAAAPDKAADGAPALQEEPAAPASAPLAPTTELVLRARRPCWLVLQVDGERLPTVMLKDGDKRRWQVRQKAVLLAGNVGALRVWWNGDNLGYLGELGTRANGMVFEPGHVWRLDKGEALDLPAGVPE